MPVITKTDVGGCEFWMKNFHGKCLDNKYKWEIKFIDSQFYIGVMDLDGKIVVETKRQYLKDSLRSLCESLKQ